MSCEMSCEIVLVRLCQVVIFGTDGQRVVRFPPSRVDVGARTGRPPIQQLSSMLQDVKSTSPVASTFHCRLDRDSACYLSSSLHFLACVCSLFAEASSLHSLTSGVSISTDLTLDSRRFHIIYKMSAYMRPAFRTASVAAVGAGVAYAGHHYWNTTSFFNTVHAESLPLKKVFPGKGFTELKLESSEVVNHNVKKLRFALPDDQSVTGIPPVSEWFCRPASLALDRSLNRCQHRF